MSSERMYSPLYEPRIVESRPRYARIRTALFIALMATLALLFWALVMVVVFVLNSGPVILR